MAIETLSPRDVPTTLNYHVTLPGGEGPYRYREEPPEGVPRTNITTEPHDVVIHDVRGKEDTIGLDKTGFQYVRHASKEKLFTDEDAIKTQYYKEVEELLKTHAGAKRVFIFDHTIRRSPTQDSFEQPKGQRGPGYIAHVDQTDVAAFNRVRDHLGADAERLLKGRFRIINVWRPIENNVAHSPLALADFYSIDYDKDLVSSRLIYPNKVGYTFGVKYNPGHRWHYLADQSPEEVVLIKCFDSDYSKARLTPHSAFKDSTSPADAPHRQSIEIRALVFDTE